MSALRKLRAMKAAAHPQTDAQDEHVVEAQQVSSSFDLLEIDDEYCLCHILDKNHLINKLCPKSFTNNMLQFKQRYLLIHHKATIDRICELMIGSQPSSRA